MAYGRILPQALLDLPRRGPFNVHASLLPKLRGAAPIQWSIIRGDAETGVSIMRMEAGLDTGPVAAMRRLPITDDDTTGTLSGKLSELGAALLVETLPAILEGRLALVPQVDADATLAPLLTKGDGRLAFDRPARLVSAQARGVDPWPGATTMLGDEVMRLFAPHVIRRRRRRAARDGASAAAGRAGDRLRRRRGRVRRAAAPRPSPPACGGGAGRAPDPAGTRLGGS